MRKEHYELLRMVIPGTLPEDLIDETELHEQIRSIILNESAYAIGRPLMDLKIEELGCKVIATRQAGKPQQKPNYKTRLKEGDILILYGPNSKLDKAENILLSGMV